MQLRIPRSTLEEIDRHAVEAYPDECCGIVLGDEDRDHVRRITNVQNRLHAKDPALYPRDARTAYFMEPGELGACLRESEEKRRPVRLFYHSHPDHGAYFSAEDRAAATPFGEPSYPEARYLVVSVQAGRVVDRLLVAWDAQSADFVDIPIFVDEDR